MCGRMADMNTNRLDAERSLVATLERISDWCSAS
jgi:hypothetical protein